MGKHIIPMICQRAVGTSIFLCSLLHTVLSWNDWNISWKLVMTESPANPLPPHPTIIKFHDEDQQDDINVCYCLKMFLYPSQSMIPAHYRPKIHMRNISGMLSICCWKWAGRFRRQKQSLSTALIMSERWTQSFKYPRRAQTFRGACMCTH